MRRTVAIAASETNMQAYKADGNKPGVFKAIPGDGTLPSRWLGDGAMLLWASGEWWPGDSIVLGPGIGPVAGEATAMPAICPTAPPISTVYTDDMKGACTDVLPYSVLGKRFMLHVIFIYCDPTGHCLPAIMCKTAVTCEIKLFWNNSEIISVFYFTCNHVWNKTLR